MVIAKQGWPYIAFNWVQLSLDDKHNKNRTHFGSIAFDHWTNWHYLNNFDCVQFSLCTATPGWRGAEKRVEGRGGEGRGEGRGKGRRRGRGEEVTQRVGKMKWHDYLHGQCHIIVEISYHASTFSVTQVRICWEGVHLRSNDSWRGGMEWREYNWPPVRPLTLSFFVREIENGCFLLTVYISWCKYSRDNLKELCKPSITCDLGFVFKTPDQLHYYSLLSAFWQPTVGQPFAYCQPSVDHLLADCQPTVSGGELFITNTYPIQNWACFLQVWL